MQFCHISDTHGHHEWVKVPKCDVLVHTGDIGGRTNLSELRSFLEWFEKQPADKKIWVAGNHDICMSKDWPKQLRKTDAISALLAEQHYRDAKTLIESYDVKYLCDTDYVYNGVKFYGSPYSPSFHRDRWVFNADRGTEIKKVWAKIPSDVDVLLTHSPAYGILDDAGQEGSDETGDNHLGCKDLFDVMNKRLYKLKLHLFGHIHDQYGILQLPVSNTRRVLFSNGAVLSLQHKLVIEKPLIITI